jgi:hypothetical protein
MAIEQSYSGRKRLPNRRTHEPLDFEHGVELKRRSAICARPTIHLAGCSLCGNGAKALATRAADDAVDRLRGIAMSLHGLNPSDVAAAINQGREIARVAGLPPPMRPSAGGGTPSTTVEALMYGLRRGLSCLDDLGNLDRLRRCDEAAMTGIASRLIDMKAQSKGARSDWTEDAVADLLAIWRAVRGQS